MNGKICCSLALMVLTACVGIESTKEPRERPPLKPLVCPSPKTMTLNETSAWVALDGAVPVTVACEDAAAADWVARHWKLWFVREIKPRISRNSGIEKDGAYRLTVAPDGIVISAKALTGVRYAMMTLRQLAMANRGVEKLTHYIAPQAAIEDDPALAWRGLHYCWFPETRVSSVERFIRLAAYLKFNYVVLENWGVFRSEKFPWLGWSDGTMTKSELKHLCTIAADLGVTLIPQVNVFGHASLSRGGVGKHATLDLAPEYQPLFEPVMGWNWCLTNPETKRVLKELIAEMHEAFGNPPYFHLGCDEAQPPSCPECSKGQYSEKVIAHIRAMAEAVEARGARAIIWHDMFLQTGDERFPNCYRNGSPAMAAAVGKLPKSVVIADWNYHKPLPDGDYPSLRHFHALGFDVLTCPWDDTKGIDAQGRFAQAHPWCGYLGTVWNHYYGSNFCQLLVHGACAAWGGDPQPFRKPWDARIMTLLRQVQWDMPVASRVECGIFDNDLPPRSAPEY